ncbi:hypothetical protein BH09BAC1_BH09BAC1_31020 [soil metagenome]
MKAIYLALCVLVLTIGATSCKKCKSEDPRARIINNGTASTSVQIKTTGGNTENINNIEPGTTSDYRSFAAGSVMYTVSVGNNSPIESTVVMAECFEYDIVIGANNTVISTPRDRND